jgi:type IV secretory pathway TraG/TraD family ATPase VirD4
MKPPKPARAELSWRIGTQNGLDSEILLGRENDKATSFGFSAHAEEEKRRSSLLTYSREGHLLTVAPTGAGKGRSAIIPTLLTYAGPTITIDPKGEAVVVTGRYRRQIGHKVIVLDPFQLCEKSERLNRWADCGNCCTTTILITTWRSCSTRRLFRARLPTTSSSDKTRPCIRSTACTYVKALGSAAVAESLGPSTFDLHEVVAGAPITIFIVIPPDKLTSHRGLLRLWIGTLLTAMTRRRRIPRQRTLFILDECSALGTSSGKESIFPTFVMRALSQIRRFREVDSGQLKGEQLQ